MFDSAVVAECTTPDGQGNPYHRMWLLASMEATPKCDDDLPSGYLRYDPANCDEAIAFWQIPTLCGGGYAGWGWKDQVYTTFHRNEPNDTTMETFGAGHDRCTGRGVVTDDYEFEFDDPTQHITLTNEPGSDVANLDFDTKDFRGSFDALYCALPPP